MISRQTQTSFGECQGGHGYAQGKGWCVLVAFCALLLTSSCSLVKVPPTPEQPIEAPKAFSQEGQAVVAERWWESLGDAELNGLVEEALGGNFDLQIAWDRLAQAAALARKAGAAAWPALTAEAAGARFHSEGGTARGSRDGTSPSITSVGLGDTADDSTTGNTFSLGLAASYEVDLWGRVRSTRRAAGFNLAASGEDLAAAAMTLSAEVASTWYRLVEQRAILRILAEQIRTNEDLLGTVEFRFGHSKGSVVDVFQQQRQLESTKGGVPVAAMRMQVLEHQLAVLLGKVPQEKASGQSLGLLETLPPLPATGLPAELVRRRPDLLAAYARLASANQSVAAAVADRFPALRLSGRAETDAEEVGDLFDNWLASVAGNLVGPILDGGSRAAEVDRARAVASERLHDYSRLVLRAFLEVEDALVSEQRQREYLDSLEKQIELSRKLLTGARLRYVNGDTDYLPVLEAISTLQRLERSRIEAHRALIEYRIALCRSLGGGWDLTRAPQDEATNEPDLGGAD